MTEKLTPWFPGDVKPVHEGVYPRDYVDGVYYSRWDGADWSHGWAFVEIAARCTLPSPHQSLPWRGLAQDPSKEGV